MTHVYYQPIAVTLVQGLPATIRWRSITYQVLEVNEPWHLMDRWWESSGADQRANAGNPGPDDWSTRRNRSDRTYYRVRCVSAHEDITCEIYFDAIGAFWILERVYD